jgi:hypothetical protein
MDSENLEDKIQAYKELYFVNNKKNKIFKSTQKLDCAKEISNHFPIEKLLQSSVYILPNSNCIYIDYPKVKHFLCPDIYDLACKYFYNLHQEILKTYTHFNIRGDLKSITMTAVHRHTDIIKYACSTYLGSNELSEKIELIQIYNSPSIVRAILNMFSTLIAQSTVKKVQILS